MSKFKVGDKVINTTQFEGNTEFGLTKLPLPIVGNVYTIQWVVNEVCLMFEELTDLDENGKRNSYNADFFEHAA